METSFLPPHPWVPSSDTRIKSEFLSRPGEEEQKRDPGLWRVHTSLASGASPTTPSSVSAPGLGYRGPARIFTGYENSTGKAV